MELQIIKKRIEETKIYGQNVHLLTRPHYVSFSIFQEETN